MWWLIAWIAISFLCTACWAIGSAIGYERGWDDATRRDREGEGVS